MLRKMYSGLNGISNVVCKLLTWLVVLLVIACTATVFLQVINRYIIVKISDYSFSFTDELSRWLMINITYLTIGICVREGSMAQVDLIYERLGRGGKMFLYLLTRALMLVVLYIGIYYGIRIMNLRAPMSSPILDIPGRILYAPPVIGTFLMALEWLTDLVGVLAGELEPFKGGSRRNFPGHEEPAASIEDEVPNV